MSQWNLEWLNHNSQRHYPLTADSSRTDVTDSITLPDDFLVGLDLPVSPAMGMETGRFFLHQLGHFASGFQLIFAYDDGTSYIDVATAIIPADIGGRNKVFSLNGMYPFTDIVGSLVIGRLDSIASLPVGLFSFTLETARIEPQAIRPMIRGISSIRVVDANGNPGEPLYGDIELVAGSNIQLSTVDSAGETRIIISALSGEGTIEGCVCEGDAAKAPCLQSINGIRPTPNGNFTIVGDTCFGVVALSNGIKITDTCSKPCCGCDELEIITRELERINAERASIDAFVRELQTESRTFNMTVLGARLNDRACLSCD